MGGRIKSIEEFFGEYEKQYYKLHKDVIPYMWGGVEPQNKEKVYKQALEQGKTWQEIVGYDETKNLIL